MDTHKNIILLGATGSIGQTTLNIVSRDADQFHITAVSAHTEAEKLREIQHNFHIRTAALSVDAETEDSTDFPYRGSRGLVDMVRETEADLVVNGITGAAGLAPSIAALESGKDLILANKETAVMAGPLIFKLAEKFGRRIIPVDSEHSAILQLIRFRPPEMIDQVILTASGGPFAARPEESFRSITPAEALRHPTWNMGRKISIDSATLANKGLEIIETHIFFSLPPEKIDVVIHPQSIIHSMISTTDGCFYAQLSSTDMKVPILNALLYPEIATEVISPFNPVGMNLSFAEPDRKKFPMLDFAYYSLIHGGSYPIAYNAANEIAVNSFLNEQISFNDIPRLTGDVLDLDFSAAPASFDEVFAADRRARKMSLELIGRL